jgi:hypothetical protein
MHMKLPVTSDPISISKPHRGTPGLGQREVMCHVTSCQVNDRSR